jgi:hypothetical protein
MDDQQQPEPQPKPYAPKPRFLAPKARAGDGHGYVNLPALAMAGEPECLDQDDWDRHVGKEVDQRAKARAIERERTARLLSQEERIVKAQAEARAKRRDVSREVAVLRQMQARQRPPAKIEKRVQILEQVVYLGRAA